jgi:L-fuconolactonase
MVVVDSHVHTSTVWWEPIEVHLFHMDRNGVDQAVLIQFWQQADNSYHFDVQRRYPGRFANVVYVDWRREDAIDNLRALAKQGAAGIRLRPEARSPGGDPYSIWREAAKLNLTVDCGGKFFADENDRSFPTLVEEVPDVRIVIEHLGGMHVPDKTDLDRLRRKLAFGLAKYPNIYIKIHGLGEFAERALPPRKSYPFVEPIPPLLEEVYEIFGPERMLWGSDYPNTSHNEGYSNALNLCRDQFSDKPQAHRDLIFGGVAMKLFPCR